MQRVLDLVVEVAQDPVFASSEQSHVAGRLATEAAEGREAIRQSLDVLRAALTPQLNLEPLFGDSQRLAALACRAVVDTRAFDTAITSRVLGGRESFMFDLAPSVSVLALSRGLMSRATRERWGATARLPNPGVPKLGWLQRFSTQLRAWLDRMREALPANWRELKADEIDRAVELMKSDGLNLAWAPREEIVRLLIEAETHAARCEVLASHCVEVVDDVQTVLRSIERPDLQPIAAAGQEAILTFRDGHAAPAQTYAAAAVGEILHGSLRYPSFGKLQRAFRRRDPLHDVDFRVLGLFAVGHALARTLDSFAVAGEGFNRNLTVHRIGSAHSEPNLLMVLLLLAGLLPEVERLLDQEEARALELEAT